MASRGAEHCLSVASNVDRQRLLHRSCWNMCLGHLIVLAIVREKIAVQCKIKNLTELLSHFKVLFEIDTETFEFIGLVPGPCSEHQPTMRKGLGYPTVPGDPRAI